MSVGMKIGLLELVRIFANASAADVLQLHDPSQLFAIDSLGIEDHAVGIGARNRLGTKMQQLLDGVLRNIAAAGNQAELAFERVLTGLQHFSREINAAITGSLRTNQRTAPAQAFAGQHAGELIAHALVLAKEEANFASAHADVASGNVSVRANVAATVRS